MTTLRLLYSPPQNGIINMATDHAVMEAVGDGRVLPTLRLYAWQPACLSLGYTQRLREVDQTRLQAKSWDLVRRPTGGKAILHTDEITYSVCFPQEDTLVQGDIVTSYRRLSQALQEALKILGLPSQTAPYEKNGGQTSPICFETPSAYEITVAGRKLIGSAQVRRQKAVLQHGSLPLYGDIARICDVLAFEDENAREIAKKQVHRRATTLSDCLGRQVTWDTAAEALVEGFARAFDFSLEIETLSPLESLRLEQLRQDIYATSAWLNKR